ncbi:MAG: DnaB-like helicase C-terminal domain-containing protein [Candidatus Electrothrix aestuarii]|uniref:DnaB-like helicase C-terminal domain-containing protein n=1 Tax=Candidatus Electrothrix aestuarii TaxID=3062594 RepID=A0AAU8LUA8_9BACT|nr:DnaB-like helicase C-terminal domain-containing protein [Candidatus Electrothrix aestuarii]
MHSTDPITAFYLRHVPGAKLQNKALIADCPFCSRSSKATDKKKKSGENALVIFLNPDSYFHGYYRCLNRCSPGGFPLHFARQTHLDLSLVPGFDPDRDYAASQVDYPVKNINHEVRDFMDRMTEDLIKRFAQAGISRTVLREMKIGYNGRYLVYPYIQDDGNCYAARCVHPDKPEDNFWHGDEEFAQTGFRIFNMEDIQRCENGSLVIIEGEDNLLAVRQLGLPGIALPDLSEFAHLETERLAWLNTVFLCVNHSPESMSAARELATRIGFKIRMIRWPDTAPRHFNLVQLAREEGKGFQQEFFKLILEARSFSPFSSPEREFLHFEEQLNMQGGESYQMMLSGFSKMDKALGGLHGVNIMGGLPKAGKSCFFIQVATEMARRKVPVIYYDFENGRQKIYQRTLSRLSRLSADQLQSDTLTEQEQKQLQAGKAELQNLLPWFRVVTDRKLDPKLMRSHIDFLRHETKSEYTMVIIDSLHKLPFKDFSERRTGIDAWLRHLEAIRDELNVSFLVISELTRGDDGQYDKQPQLGAFKGSGDIEYSADNAMVLLPQWDPFSDAPPEERENALWLVASREHTPGLIGFYKLDYPFWGFTEK